MMHGQKNIKLLHKC